MYGHTYADIYTCGYAHLDVNTQNLTHEYNCTYRHTHVTMHTHIWTLCRPSHMDTSCTLIWMIHRTPLIDTSTHTDTHEWRCILNVANTQSLQVNTGIHIHGHTDSHGDNTWNLTHRHDACKDSHTRTQMHTQRVRHGHKCHPHAHTWSSSHTVCLAPSYTNKQEGPYAHSGVGSKGPGKA